MGDGPTAAASPPDVAIGFHASHEQLTPSALLTAVQLAEAAGFHAAMCSDHLAPWSARQGHAGHAWSWLGAAMHASRLPFGVVTSVGQRYHPVVAAQAIATLGELFPGRLWVALGSGEQLNEHVTGHSWPPKPARDRRLDECAAIVRALLAGDEVSHDGTVRVHRARLWVRPSVPPLLLAAAVGPETAERVAAWADGLATVDQPLPDLRRTVEAFRAAGGAGKPVVVQAHLSWAPTDDEALAIAHDQWRNALVAPPAAWELPFPADFDAATRHAVPDDIRRVVHVSADPARHAAWIQEVVDGVRPTTIHLHHVGQEQAAFIRTFGEEVLPRCRS